MQVYKVKVDKFNELYSKLFNAPNGRDPLMSKYSDQNYFYTIRKDHVYFFLMNVEFFFKTLISSMIAIYKDMKASEGMDIDDYLGRMNNHFKSITTDINSNFVKLDHYLGFEEAVEVINALSIDGNDYSRFKKDLKRHTEEYIKWKFKDFSDLKTLSTLIHLDSSPF